MFFFFSSFFYILGDFAQSSPVTRPPNTAKNQHSPSSALLRPPSLRHPTLLYTKLIKHVIQDILAPDQAYEGLYGQGNGTANGRAYQQGKYCV